MRQFYFRFVSLIGNLLSENREKSNKKEIFFFYFCSTETKKEVAMKRIITLLLLACLAATAGFAKPKTKTKNISGIIAINGELKEPFRNAAAGTPVVIRSIIEDKKNRKLLYAVEINGIQETLSEEEMDVITLSAPQTDQEFRQQIYMQYRLYEHFNKRGYKPELRREIDEECFEYLDKLNEIAYQDDYITSYVQGVFAKLTPVAIAPGRSEQLNVLIIQSPDPDAYMLPNGSMLISTGLLATLDAEDELAAVMAAEVAHFILDHQVENIYRTERRAKRALFRGSLL